MIKHFTFLFILSLFTAKFAYANETVIVTDQTIKLSGEEVFYFGFLKGDEIVFDLKVVKGKNVKEVEIVEYPSTSKYADFKTNEISSKKILVQKTAVYAFKIKGGGLGTKVCQMKILRIPGNNNSVDFDTSVEWRTRRDSTYFDKVRKNLIRIDTNAVDIMDRLERVHSSTNLSNSNISDFVVDLPTNKYEKLNTSELISWGYWIGVGNEGQVQYEKDKKDFLLKNTSTVSSLVSPMAGLALGAFTVLNKPPKGDNVHYWFNCQLNGQALTLAEGNSVVSFGRNTDILQGSFRVTLQNDNVLNGINVTVKITAIIVSKIFEEERYKELVVKEVKYPDVKEGE